MAGVEEVFVSNEDQKLDKQSESIVSDAEKYSDISQFESILAGIGSGVIQIPKGIFSLGASLIDLGAGTNKAAQVEKYFDDLTNLDEKAAATTAGKIAELLVNIGIPGGVGFKIGTSMANTALRSKKLGKYFNITDNNGKILMESASKVARLNSKGRVAKFGVGAITGGIAEGIFIGDVQKAGTFGDLLGGPTKLHENKGDNYEPGRALVNRVKFGTEGALFTGLIGGLGKTLKLLAGRTEAMRYADNAIDKNLFNFVSKFKKEGKMTPELFEQSRKVIGQKYKDANVAQTIARNLNQKIDGLFPWVQSFLGKSTKPQKKEFLELLNDGLISGTPKVLDNGTVKFGNNVVRSVNLDGKTIKKINVTGGIDKKFKTKIENFLKKKDIKYTKEQVNGIFEQMEAMRGEWADMFSTLGKGIKAGEKTLKKELAGTFNTFKSQFGDKFKNYLGATYDVFSNRSIIPLMSKKVPEEIMNRAITVFREAAKKNKTPITYQEGMTLVNNMVKSAKPPANFASDIQVTLPDFFTSKSLAQKVTSKKLDLSYLKPNQRKVIDETLGKTRDPVQTILAQTGEISAYARRNVLLGDLVRTSATTFAKGGRPLFFNSIEEVGEVAAKQGDSFDASMYREIDLSKTADVTSPANGKLALKEVADAIEAASGKAQTTWADNNLYRNLVLLPKATSQMAKTILSPITHARNFISAGAFAVANGLAPGIGITGRNAKAAWKNLQVAGIGTRAETELYQKLARLGVVNSNVNLGDLRGLLKDIDFGSVVSADRGLSGLLKPLSKLKKWTEDAYTAEDDFWKIVTFLGERSRYAAAYKRAGKKITDDQLDDMAANIVRNNVPNYDYVSQTVKSLRRLPIGNFVSFPAEIMRTSTNIVKQALKEIRDPALRRIGWQRLTGMTFVTAAVPYGATKLGQALYDVSEDELAAIRRFVAPWAKNGTIIPIKDDNGEFKYINFSHANAYDTLVKPLQAAMNEVADGQLNDEAIVNNFILGSMKGFKEILNPFISESIWTEAVVDVIPTLGRGGRTIEGYEIYNKELPAGEKAKAIFLHLVKAQMPGSLKQIGRIDYAVEGVDTFLQTGQLGPFKWGKIGKYDENGNSYELLDEGLGIIGMRAIKLKPENALQFKQAAFATSERKSRSIFNKVALKKGPIDPVELVDAYIMANEAMWKAQKTMSDDMSAAKLLGLNESELYEATKRVGKQTFGRLNQKTFNPYYPTKGVLNSMYTNAEKLKLPFVIDSGTPAGDAILKIYNSILEVNLKPGSEFPVIINPLKVIGESTNEQSLIPFNKPIGTPAVDSNMLSSMILKPNVNATSGLTEIQETLYSPTEKLMAKRMNKNRGTA